MLLKKRNPLVGILMGSDSDLPIMTEAARTLQEFGITFELEIASAHRSPARSAQYARSAAKRGLKVIIVGAGGAFHLGGAIASETTLPVLAVPMPNSPLGGLDSLLSTVQMPSGVPVGVMGLGKSGAVNAAILAAQILAISDSALSRKLSEHKQKMAQEVAAKSARLKKEFHL
ncbi:MAG: 5-(carboxyamino)imidazole ribonucleotide mutase [Acidobacteria bacterium]|nr:5-(carboxyamino)imidazole ribonucleotide mutase [Acidobacteriota bacterium]